MNIFACLSSDVFSEIFSYLDQFDLCGLSSVDKFFSQLAILKKKLQPLENFVKGQVNFWQIYKLRDGYHLTVNGHQISTRFKIIDMPFRHSIFEATIQEINKFTVLGNPRPHKNSHTLRKYLLEIGMKRGDYFAISHPLKISYLNEFSEFIDLPMPLTIEFKPDLDLRVFHFWRFSNYKHPYMGKAFWRSFDLPHTRFYVPKLGFYLQFKIEPYYVHNLKGKFASRPENPVYNFSAWSPFHLMEFPPLKHDPKLDKMKQVVGGDHFFEQFVRYRTTRF